jgi:hypothetical protein
MTHRPRFPEIGNRSRPVFSEHEDQSYEPETFLVA